MEYGTGTGIGTYGIISFFFSYSPFLLRDCSEASKNHSLLFSFLNVESDTTFLP
jgi:hypothetical protein